MCEQFVYRVSTVLPQDRVWELFGDIETWAKVSDLYSDLRWSGFPWKPYSSIVGRISYPHPLHFRYMLERCEPASLVSYVAHSPAGGFATHRTIRFEPGQGRTWIEVESYAVGDPMFAIAGGSLGFLKMLTEQWFPAFARFCDNHAYTNREVHGHTLRMIQSKTVEQSKRRY